MGMTMVRIEVMVRMAVTGAVGMDVFMLVKNDLQLAAKHVGNPAQRSQAGHMGRTFEARDHRFRHAETLRQLQLGFARVGAEVQQLAGALRGNSLIVVRPVGRACLGHLGHLAKMLSTT